MNIVDAAHNTVHDYPGGSEALAPRMGMSAAVLRNKVNPNNRTHHLTLEEADRMVGLTGDFRLLHAFAGNHGFVLAPAAAGEGTESVASLLLAASADEGDFSRLLREALVDGLITENEAKSVCNAGAAVQAAMVSLLSNIRARVGRRVSE